MKRIGILQVPIDEELLTMVTGCINKAASLLHFSKEDILRAELVTEEVFMFLVREPGHKGDVRIVLNNGRYYLKISFFFTPISFPLEALNITLQYNPSLSPPSTLGILIAARSVERFIYVHENPRETAIHLMIEKQYPEYNDIPAVLPLPDPSEPIRFSRGTHEEMKQASIRIMNRYQKHVPSFFAYPGKVVDMVESGEYGMVIAGDAKGNVHGCMLWKYKPHLIEAYGPYIFHHDPTMAEGIVRSVLETIGKSKVIGFLIQYPTPETPFSWFEELPSLSSLSSGNLPGQDEFFPLYRELQEDKGSLVVVHPELVPLVKAWYQARDLPRDVVSSIPAGERVSGQTAFSVHTDKNQNCGVMKLRTMGNDASSVLTTHVALLQKNGFSSVLYEMDLTDERESLMYPELVSAGFLPTYILPWIGKGDILVFRYHPEKS